MNDKQLAKILRKALKDEDTLQDEVWYVINQLEGRKANA